MLIQNEIIISYVILIIFQSIFYTLTKHLYKDKINEIQKEEWIGFGLHKRFLGAILASILFVIGLNYFVISKRLSIQSAFLFGLIIAGFFNSVCYATFNAWSGIGAILDTLWISLLASLTTNLTYQYCGIIR